MGSNTEALNTNKLTEELTLLSEKTLLQEFGLKKATEIIKLMEKV